MRTTLLFAAALVAAGSSAAQVQNAGSAGAPDNTTAATAAEAAAAPAADPRLAELDLQIALAQKQTTLLTERKNQRVAENAARAADYPVATVTAKNADATSYEHTGFLADWLLSANAASLVPRPAQADAMPCVPGQPVLVVGADTATAPSLLLAQAIENNIDRLAQATRDWVVAARLEAAAARAKAGAAGGAPGKRESGLIESIMMGQSLASQSVELLKYFRTDIDFKASTVSLPTYVLRSELAGQCAGARLPEMAVPSHSALLAAYASLVSSQESMRLAMGSLGPHLSADMKAAGVALLGAIDALRANLTAPITGQPTLLVQSAQILAQADIRRIVTVRVMDEGGVAYKRTNLFFLSPRLSYVAAISVDYVMTDRDTGAVLWHTVRQARSQLNQKFSPWRGAGVQTIRPAQTQVR